MAQFNTPDDNLVKIRRPHHKQRPAASAGGTDGPLRYENNKKINFHNWIIPASAVLTGTLVGLATPQLIDATGTSGAFKAVLIGAAAAFVSGVVNFYAIRDGARLAATGFALAGVASLSTVIIVGGSAATFSYAGLSLGQVNQLALREHGGSLGSYVEQAISHAAQSIQIKPIIDAAAADIQRNLGCERLTGCLSGRRGGEGPVFRVVQPLATRASEISHQLAGIEAVRKNQLALANNMVGEFQATLSDANLTTDERWQNLGRKDARIKQAVSALRETVPVSLLKGYGAELEGGVSVPGKHDVSVRINQLLRRHGSAITTALDDLKADKSRSPTFPSRAGVAQAFEQLSRFWPIGVLTASIEMLIPIALWVYTYLAIFWGYHQKEHAKAAAKPSGRNGNGRRDKGGRDAV